VPFSIRKRGGRKLIVVPAGATSTPSQPRIDSAMVKALARAFRWRKLLETGVYGTIEDLALGEKINASYVSRVLRLTLLAPCIVEGVVDGRHQPELTLAKIMKSFPIAWAEQPTFMQLTSAPSRTDRSDNLPD
jgi:hypothetical protein